MEPSYFSKIIGARYYSSTSSENMSARDHDGHGTRTASTTAGNKVEGARVLQEERFPQQGLQHIEPAIQMTVKEKKSWLLLTMLLLMEL